MSETTSGDPIATEPDSPTHGESNDALDGEPSTGATDIVAAPARLQVKSIRIQNFKKIADTEIGLGPITYLVGGNNSGKSSVLQAIHTAISCAQASVELGQRVIAEASLRYSPVADFSLLGHGAPYENRSGGQRGVVEFEGVAADDDAPSTYRIEMYKARNHNNVGVDRSGVVPGFGQVICDPQALFSVYVPGLAGVPHREEMSGYAAVFRRAASGDANLVFRNIIRLLSERGLLHKLEDLLEDVLKVEVSFRVKYDSDRDLYVDVRLATGDEPANHDYLPVDLWGTGLLQVTQIFAYVILFKPSLLLVDEPDSHLHPSRQKSLGVALERVSTDFKCKVVVSTHSRHLITGASDAVKVIWMKDGAVHAHSQKELTALLLDLGALDQLDTNTRTIICTEDEDPWALRQALTTLGVPGEQVKVTSFNGLNNAFTAEAFREMASLMECKPRVIIHRDRDFLTDEELAVWSSTFADRDIDTFCPGLCDTEAYYAAPTHIAKVTGRSLEDARSLYEQVLQDNSPELYRKFRDKRRYANRNYLDGGAPRTRDLWAEGDKPRAEFVYGKRMLTLVEQELRMQGWLERSQSLKDEASDELGASLLANLGTATPSGSS